MAQNLCWVLEEEKPEAPPIEWDWKVWDYMINKSYKERLIIAGALIAAEIDRIQSNKIIIT